jgi:hypothetical protein
MRITFGVKREEIGVKVCIMWAFIIYTVCQILGYPRTVANGEGMWNAWE